MASSSFHATVADHTNVPPPSYAPAPTQPPRAHTHTHSITDLRNQIVANAIVVYPRRNSNTSEPDPPVLVVAKSPDEPRSRRHHHHGSSVGGADAEKAALQRAEEAGENGGASEKHYALLLRWSSSKNKVKILLRGERRDTVLEALESMLEVMEGKVHDKATQCGIDTAEDSCHTM